MMHFEGEEDFEESNTSGANFISCIKWVSRGKAKNVPDKIRLTKQEISEMIQNKEEQSTDGVAEVSCDNSDMDTTDVEQNEMHDGGNVKLEESDENEEVDSGTDDFEKKYGMSKYDDSDEDEFSQQNKCTDAINDLISVSHEDEIDELNDSDDNDSNSDFEDFKIKDSDNLILVGHVEKDASILEVYVYNDTETSESNEKTMYVHHDIFLPSFPLALEWLGYDPHENHSSSNMVAIGFMEPVIQVWDIDVVDVLEPAFTLGSDETRQKKTSKKKKKKSVKQHTDAVLSLSWNSKMPHVLASGSVDQTVLLWDLSECKVHTSIDSGVHTEKVQSLQWHPSEAQTLLTGCCDKYARVFDCRSPNEIHKKWTCRGEIEKVLWNLHNPFTFFTSSDTGYVEMFDVRKGENESLWSYDIRSNTVDDTNTSSDMSINDMSLLSHIPHVLTCVSSNGQISVLDTSSIKDENPPFDRCVGTSAINLGRLLSVDSCSDIPFTLCVGGDKSSDNLKVYDIRNCLSQSVIDDFESRLSTSTSIKVEVKDEVMD